MSDEKNLFPLRSKIQAYNAQVRGQRFGRNADRFGRHLLQHNQSLLIFSVTNQADEDGNDDEHVLYHAQHA